MGGEHQSEKIATEEVRLIRFEFDRLMPDTITRSVSDVKKSKGRIEAEDVFVLQVRREHYVDLRIAAEKSEARVVCAAIRHRETGEIILGARHYDNLMHAAIATSAKAHGLDWKGNADQGFIDNMRVFIDREEAWKMAEQADQIRQNSGSWGTLYSEDLY